MMKTEDFKKALREGANTFRADNISIDTIERTVTGKGLLRIVKGRFSLDVTLDDHTNAPLMPTGIKSRSEFWKVRGLIENEIDFCFEAMPSERNENYGYHAWKSLTITSCFLDLIPNGWDALTTAEAADLRKKVLTPNQPSTGLNISLEANETVKLENEPATTNIDASFDALLLDYRLIAFNGGTITTVKNDFFDQISQHSATDTFHGKLEGWKFGLIQKEKHLEVHFWSEAGLTQSSEEQDNHAFRAFLNALAFTHGKHAWPFQTKYRRDGKLVLDRIHLSEKVARTAHSPFSERLDGNARMGNLNWNFLEPLGAAFRFFRSNSKLSKEIVYLLYLLREASASGVPKRIALLGLCSLFESLVHTIYHELIAPNEHVNMQKFQAAKTKSLEMLEQLASESGDSNSYGRLIALLASASALRIKDEFKAVLNSLNLAAETRWDDIFELWRDWRNPLSHRLSADEGSEGSIKEDLVVESRIAGAINCLILKLMGYSGLVRLSTYEDIYGQI